jgi:PAS domain-containing protein
MACCVRHKTGRVVEEAAHHMAAAVRSQPDMPLIYANEAFARITGYTVAESLGKNCRFLQVRHPPAATCVDTQTSTAHMESPLHRTMRMVYGTVLISWNAAAGSFNVMIQLA